MFSCLAKKNLEAGEKLILINDPVPESRTNADSCGSVFLSDLVSQKVGFWHEKNTLFCKGAYVCTKGNLKT
jgi:hypothetical protein